MDKDKNETSAELEMFLSVGIQIAPPMITTMIYNIDCDYKQTDEEKRVSELTWKMKKSNARRNKFIVVILMIFSVAIILASVLGLALLTKSDLAQIMFGIVGAQLMIMAYYFWVRIFECDANYIRVKYEGKVY